MPNSYMFLFQWVVDAFIQLQSLGASSVSAASWLLHGASQRNDLTSLNIVTAQEKPESRKMLNQTTHTHTQKERGGLYLINKNIFVNFYGGMFFNHTVIEIKHDIFPTLKSYASVF